jgi:hypothetical protein
MTTDLHALWLRALQRLRLTDREPPLTEDQITQAQAALPEGEGTIADRVRRLAPDGHRGPRNDAFD